MKFVSAFLLLAFAGMILESCWLHFKANRKPKTKLPGLPNHTPWLWKRIIK